MLKMYHTEKAGGGSSQFWDSTWESEDFTKSLSFCAVDPLRPLFDRYARQGSLMLEGGCGLGQYVAYYSGCGVKTVGVDFAREALGRLHSRDNNLRLCVGDVSSLPFPDKTFDVYYSGGVVEHFENGAEDALNEATRVLKSEGVLLISVPYLSPLRRITSIFIKRRRFVPMAYTDQSGDECKNIFFQYAYTPSEFERLLASSGLKVISRQGFAILYGLYEIPFLYSLIKLFLGNRKAAQASEEMYPLELSSKHSTDKSNVSVSLLKRALVCEDRNIPIVGKLIGLLAWFGANMMMYVCVREG